MRDLRARSALFHWLFGFFIFPLLLAGLNMDAKTFSPKPKIRDDLLSAADGTHESNGAIHLILVPQIILINQILINQKIVDRKH